MKKFALTAIAAAALVGGAAHAYTSGTFSNGFVVPDVIHGGSNANTTAVGIINRSGGTVPVFWTFFDQDSVHLMDGCFTMTQNDYEARSWFDLSTGNFKDVRGYLLYTVGAVTAGTAAAQCNAGGTQLAAGGQISGHAVQVAAGDAAYIPVVDGPVTLRGPYDLARLDGNSLAYIRGAAQVAPGRAGTDIANPYMANAATEIVARYAVDADTSSRITVWSTGDQKGVHTVDIYNDSQARTSANFELTNAELTSFNPATEMPARPSTYTDGFIVWNPGILPTSKAPAGAQNTVTSALANQGGSVFVYTTIDAKMFGAVQTVLGAHR